MIKKQLHLALARINAMDKRKCGKGLCALVREQTRLMGLDEHLRGDIQSLFMRLTWKWPHFNGSVSYPVPCTPDLLKVIDNSSCPDRQAAYEYALSRKTMWVGEYGAMRQDLLDYLIERTS